MDELLTGDASEEESESAIVLDALDRSIIDVLVRDARLSVRAIARELGRSPGTVGDRVSRLEATKVIAGYHADVDLTRLGFIHTLVVVRSSAEHDLDSCVEAIWQLDEVRTVWVVTGAWDLVVEANVRNPGHLRELLQTKLRAIPGVRQTEAMIVLETMESQHGSTAARSNVVEEYHPEHRAAPG